MARETCFIAQCLPLAGAEKLTSMPSTVSPHAAVPDDHGYSLENPRGEYAVRCTLTRTLFHSIRVLWDAVMYMMKQAPERISTLERNSSNVDSSTLSLRRAVVRSHLEAYRCDDCSPCTGPFSMHAAETGASGRICPQRYRAAVECCFVDDHNQGRTYLSNQFDYLT